jgi:hypothetical protein
MRNAIEHSPDYGLLEAAGTTKTSWYSLKVKARGGSPQQPGRVLRFPSPNAPNRGRSLRGTVVTG